MPMASEWARAIHLVELLALKLVIVSFLTFHALPFI